MARLNCSRSMSARSADEWWEGRITSEKCSLRVPGKLAEDWLKAQVFQRVVVRREGFYANPRCRRRSRTLFPLNERRDAESPRRRDALFGAEEEARSGDRECSRLSLISLEACCASLPSFPSFVPSLRVPVN